MGYEQEDSEEIDTNVSYKQLEKMDISYDTYNDFERISSSSLSEITAYIKKHNEQYMRAEDEFEAFKKDKEVSKILTNNDQFAVIPMIVFNKKDKMLYNTYSIIQEMARKIKFLELIIQKYKKAYNATRAQDTYSGMLTEFKTVEQERFLLLKEALSDSRKTTTEFIKMQTDATNAMLSQMSKALFELSKMQNLKVDVETKHIPYTIKGKIKDADKTKDEEIQID